MMKKLLFVLLVVALGVVFLFGCTGAEDFNVDVLTQKPRSDDKTDITVMVKYAFSINGFEEKIEKVFPNINIIQVGNYSADMGVGEYEARLKNDDLTDIVMTWPLDTGMEYWENRLMDLSTLSLTSRYTKKSLNTVSYGQDGKLYYLPGPSQVRGIVYNKTMFAENGWELPTDLDGFIALCKKIESEKSGVRALQLGLKNSEVLDTAFVGYSYGKSFSTPENASNLAAYDEGAGSFGDYYGDALTTFQRLITEGVLTPDDLNVDYSEREKMLFNRQCAMVEDSSLLTRMGASYGNDSDEFALMPFFNEGEYNDWSRLYPVCYIGLNKHLEESQNAEKLNAVLQVLDYISTADGQNALASDTGAMFSNLKGMTAPEVPEIAALTNSLNAGRYGIFPTLKNAQSALRAGLAGMVDGSKSAADVIKMVDEQNKNPAHAALPKVYGSATDNFTMIETGNFFTDVMRAEANADVALFMDNGKDGLYNGKGLSGRLYKGEITEKDIFRIMPDLKYGETDEIVVVSMTGANLKKTLEYSIPINGNSGWFYYFSGLKMKFAPSAAPGDRIKSIETSDGKAIDDNKLYTVAVIDKTVSEEYIQAQRATGKFVRTAVAQKIEGAKTISPSKDGRFQLA